MTHLASALSIFTLSLLAVPLAVRVGRSETFVNAVVALMVALSYFLLTEMAKSEKNPRPDLLVWLPNLIVIYGAVLLLRRASRH
jgi:lipopolysaccharide export LptBFGC system permease protein LptF